MTEYISRLFDTKHIVLFIIVGLVFTQILVSILYDLLAKVFGLSEASGWTLLGAALSLGVVLFIVIPSFSLTRFMSRIQDTTGAHFIPTL